MAAKKYPTKLDQTELVVLAAIFARSNMGHGRPSKASVENWKNHTDWRTKLPSVPDLNSCVCAFSGEFMETNEHEDWFMTEAKSWLKDLKKMTYESIAQTWPDIAELFWRDAATYVDKKR